MSGLFGDVVIWSALSLSAGVFVLALFDVSLPRGDALGVSGALSVAALFVAGPLVAVSATVFGKGAAYLVRDRRCGLRRLVSSLVAELSGLLVAVALFLWLPRGEFELPSTLAAGLAATAFLATELLVSQMFVSVQTGRPLGRLVRGNWMIQMPLLLAQLSAASLLVLTFPTMHDWSVLLAVALLLLIRQSYALLLGVRETYRTTVEVLVKAAEGEGCEKQGHAERTALIAREIGQRCGLSPAETERISYAALLHDIEDISRDSTRGSERGHSSDILEGVGFFEDVVRVIRVCEGRPSSDSPDGDLLAGYVVALASDIDAKESFGTGAECDIAVGALARHIPARLKARVVAAAVELGYSLPAVT